MENPEKCFFLTSKSSKNLYLCLLKDQSLTYDRFLYYPTLFETMSGHQIHNFKRKFTAKFLYWSLLNRKKMANPVDSRILACRIFDANFEILSCVIAGICLNKFFGYFKTPFLDLLFEGTKFSVLQIKKYGVFGIVGYGVYRSVRNLVENPYLFDLAMKYKEDFAGGMMISPNCEGVYQKWLGMRY